MANEIQCNCCGGSGAVEVLGPEDEAVLDYCPMCNGTGAIPTPTQPERTEE